MDEEIDHGPIIAQKKLSIAPWPDHYATVEEKLGRAGGKILGELMPKWIKAEIPEKPQDHKRASFTKLIKKTDGLLNLKDKPEENLRKAVELSPNFGLAIYSLGVVYERQGKVNEAIKELEKVFPANSNQPGLAFELGLLYYRAATFLPRKRKFFIGIYGE